MPTYRIGIGSEFNLKDRKVGIGSESPIGDLDITGIIKSANLYTSGISTLITYSGFSASNKDRDSITLGYNDRQIYTMSVTNNGTDHYTFSNAADRKGVVTGGDPDITINVGDTLKITNTVGATHPLWINHTQGTGNGNGVSDVIGNGDARNNAVVTWIPTESGVYYYNCQHHANMTGRITVQAVSFDRNYSTELDIVVGVGETFTLLSDTTLNVGSISDVKVGNTFRMPVGDRPEVPVEGTVRFNRDLNTLEFYNGVEWRQFTVNGQSGRALFGGGDDAGGVLTNISSLQFMTLGNAVFFGDLTVARTNPGGCSSEIRGVWAGGEAPGVNNTIDYNAIASGGTGADFGNLASSHRYKVGCSSSTRGLFGAGSTPSATNVIEYVEIATTGDAADFGDLMGNGMINSGSFASRTRGFFVDKNVSADQECQVVTIASKGNAISYLPQGLPGGDMNGDAGRGCSNSTRGIFVGAGQTKNIDCVDLVSDGITYDFGDMTQAKYGVGCSASPLRGVLYGGWTPTRQNTIEYVTFASMGNAVDFGDATHAIRETASNVSDCHGGLGGY